jgi:hypothetical protein
MLVPDNTQFQPDGTDNTVTFIGKSNRTFRTLRLEFGAACKFKTVNVSMKAPPPRLFSVENSRGPGAASLRITEKQENNTSTTQRKRIFISLLLSNSSALALQSQKGTGVPVIWFAFGEKSPWIRTGQKSSGPTSLLKSRTGGSLLA